MLISAFYGEEPVGQEFFSNERHAFQQQQPQYINAMATRNYTKMNDVSHAHAQAYHILNTLDYSNKKPMEDNLFEQQVKMEFEDSISNNQYNQAMSFQENISQSLPDIRDSYFQHTQQNACASDLQRTKSLSHSPCPIDSDSGSSDGGDSPKPSKRSFLSKKDSSRPRMYKFNPKPLTLNPSMKTDPDS